MSKGRECEASLVEMLPDVPQQYLPSAYQYKVWGEWVEWSLGADPVGEFLGACPLHDPAKEELSAVFNFARGVIRCQGSPSCHAPKHAMSLNNVASRMSPA